jgi:hypothetical protein
MSALLYVMVEGLPSGGPVRGNAAAYRSAFDPDRPFLLRDYPGLDV